jgi:hypothetical protein
MHRSPPPIPASCPRPEPPSSPSSGGNAARRRVISACCCRARTGCRASQSSMPASCRRCCARQCLARWPGKPTASTRCRSTWPRPSSSRWTTAAAIRPSGSAPRTPCRCSPWPTSSASNRFARCAPRPWSRLSSPTTPPSCRRPPSGTTPRCCLRPPARSPRPRRMRWATSSHATCCCRACCSAAGSCRKTRRPTRMSCSRNPGGRRPALPRD